MHPLCSGWSSVGQSSSGSAQPQRWQRLCDDSSLSRKEFYVLLMQITTTDVRWPVQTGAGFHIWKWRQSGITTAGIETKVRLKAKPADPTRCQGNEATLGRGAAGSLCPKKTPCAAMLLLSFEVALSSKRSHFLGHKWGKGKEKRLHFHSRAWRASPEFPTKAVLGEKSKALSARWEQAIC